MEISEFVGNFALFYVVVLFFFYLNSFGQENENTQRDTNVTDSAVTRPELWRFFNIYSMIFHDWHLLNNYNSLTKADTLNLNTAYESLY